MNLAISYRFSGEDPQDVNNMLKRIDSILINNNHTPFIFSKYLNWQEEGFIIEEIMPFMFQKIQQQDAMLAIIKNSDKSEGMLLEIGYALALNKKLILAIRRDAESPFLRSLADQVIEFDRLDELYKKVERV